MTDADWAEYEAYFAFWEAQDANYCGACETCVRRWGLAPSCPQKLLEQFQPTRYNAEAQALQDLWAKYEP